MHLRRSSLFPCGLAAALAFLAGLPAPGADAGKKPAGNSPPPIPPREPERRELWGPSEALEEVLRRHPDALVLTPEEYETLVRDAGRLTRDADEKPPVEIAIEALKLKGRVESGAREVLLDGELTLTIPGEGWGQTHFSWMLDLTSVASDGDVLLSQSPKDDKPQGVMTVSTPPQLFLHARGPGRCTVRFQTTLPVQLDPETGDRALEIGALGCTGTLELAFPPDAWVRSGFPHEQTDGTHRFLVETHRIGNQVKDIPMDHGIVVETTTAWIASARVVWTENASASPGALRWNPKGEVSSRIDESFLRSTWKLRGGLADGAREHRLRLPLVPAGSGIRVESVRGRAVETWRQDGDTLELTLARIGREFFLQVDLSRSIESISNGALMETSLPGLDLGGEVAVSTSVTLAEGLEALAATGVRGADFSGAGTGSFRHAAGPAPPVLSLRTAQPRVEADVDTLARLEKDSVLLTRTVAFRTDRPFRSARLILPEGEELNEVTSQKGPALDWKQVDRVVEVRFASAVTRDAPATLQVSSRKKLARAWSGAGIAEDATIASLGLPDAVKVAGYTALDFDESWKVALGAARGLEDRDARLTPVKGRMAWFGLRDWELPFTVERGASVYSAELTAYALPRSRTIEIEGQVRLEISGAPLRSFRMQLPPEIAPSLRWTSREIGEQQVDAESGIWTCTLVQEMTGRPVLRFRLSLPAIEKPPGRAQGDGPDAPLGSTRLAADLPHFAMPEARRFQGTWVVEANTDTELSLTAKSMQPLDVLRVPAVQDYQPRHRIVAAYRFGAGENALSLNARRHSHAEMAALVILKQTMRSVLGTDGTAFHETRIDLRHSGEQFVALRLPDEALLLSTTVDGAAVKPVRGPDGSVAIPLPGGSANADSTLIVVQYRLAGDPWSGRGKLALAPPQPLGDIPVLETRWEIHAPEGWRYGTGETTLSPDHTNDPVALLTAIRHCLVPGHVADVKAVQKLLWRGYSAFELGDYDDAILDYEEVLRLDPHNAAARRGMEHVEMKKGAYFDSARDHQRARMLNEVNEAWEDSVPGKSAAPEGPILSRLKEEPVSLLQAGSDRHPESSISRCHH